MRARVVLQLPAAMPGCSRGLSTYRVPVGCRPATTDRARGTWVGQQHADPNSATAPNAIPKRTICQRMTIIRRGVSAARPQVNTLFETVSTVLFNTVDTPLLSSPFHASLIDEKTSNSSVNSASVIAPITTATGHPHPAHPPKQDHRPRSARREASRLSRFETRLGQSKRHCQRSSPKPTSTCSASHQQTTSPSRRPVKSTSALNGLASISRGPLTRTGPQT